MLGAKKIIKIAQCFTELLKKITLTQFFETRCNWGHWPTVLPSWRGRKIPLTYKLEHLLCSNIYMTYENTNLPSSSRQNRAICLPPGEQRRDEGSAFTRSMAPLRMQYNRHYASAIK